MGGNILAASAHHHPSQAWPAPPRQVSPDLPISLQQEVPSATSLPLSPGRAAQQGHDHSPLSKHLHLLGTQPS